MQVAGIGQLPVPSRFLRSGAYAGRHLLHRRTLAGRAY
jgi:hypothetical protein